MIPPPQDTLRQSIPVRHSKYSIPGLSSDVPLGYWYNHERRVLSGGDQLTKERQIGAQRHMMCGNSIQERLELLEPTSEDWHCMGVS